MSALADFYDHILPELQGVSTAVVDHMLIQVAREFFKDTEVHTSDLAAISVVAGTSSYTLTSLVEDTEVVRVKAAWYDDVPLDIAPESVLVTGNPDWTTSTGEPRAYLAPIPGEIILFPEPDESLASGLRVQVVLRPTVDAAVITDVWALEYMECLAYGVKGKLMAQPSKPWTNPDMATYNLAMYAASKSEASADVRRSFAKASLSVRMRPFA
jgi:hypothetical protein